jgi:TonB family protein
MGRTGHLMPRRLSFFVFAAMVAPLLAITVVSGAPVPKKVVGSLASQLKGKVCFLRQPLQGDSLKFAANGKLLSHFEPGIWPAHTGFRVDSVKRKGGELSLDGRRVLTYFDKAGMRQSVVTTEKLHIDLALDGAAGSPQLYSALKWVFMVPGLSPDLGAAPVPPKPDPLLPGELRTMGRLPNGESIYCCGKEITPPRAVEAPDPLFPDELRKKGYEGKVVLSVVIDSEGNVNTIRVARTLHPLFEAAAAMAVKDWKFEPAKLNGGPVAAVTNVEMYFRLP